MIEILPRVLNMDCKWPNLAFYSEIPLFYSFERWSKYLRLGKIDTLVQQFYGCSALQVFEPVTWLKTIEAKSCVFVRNKFSNIVSLNCCYHLKYESYIHVFSSEKVVSSESGEKYADIKHYLQAKTAQNSSKQICWWILMSEDNREWTFSHWRKRYYGLWTYVLATNVKTHYRWICFLQTRSFSLHKMLIDELEWCGLFVDYCNVFISCLNSHSDGTHSLQRIHWWASDVMLNFFKSVLM